MKLYRLSIVKIIMPLAVGNIFLPASRRIGFRIFNLILILIMLTACIVKTRGTVV